MYTFSALIFPSTNPEILTLPLEMMFPAIFPKISTSPSVVIFPAISLSVAIVDKLLGLILVGS